MKNIFIDMWYGDDPNTADAITASYYPNDCEYRGNILKNGKYIGDFSTADSLEIKRAFPQLQINWD